jgi:hypothetical protein
MCVRFEFFFWQAPVARQKIRPKRWFEAAPSTAEFGVLRATEEAGKLGNGTVQQLL